MSILDKWISAFVSYYNKSLPMEVLLLIPRPPNQNDLVAILFVFSGQYESDKDDKLQPGCFNIEEYPASTDRYHWIVCIDCYGDLI